MVRREWKVVRWWVGAGRGTRGGSLYHQPSGPPPSALSVWEVWEGDCAGHEAREM